MPPQAAAAVPTIAKWIFVSAGLLLYAKPYFVAFSCNLSMANPVSVTCADPYVLSA